MSKATLKVALERIAGVTLLDFASALDWAQWTRIVASDALGYTENCESRLDFKHPPRPANAASDGEPRVTEPPGTEPDLERLRRLPGTAPDAPTTPPTIKIESESL